MSEQGLRKKLQQQDVEGVLALVEQYLPGQPGNATRRNNLSGARIYLRWVAENGASPLLPTPEHGEAYLAFLKCKHPDTPASVINRLAHARNLYAAMNQAGLSLPDPFSELEAPSNDPADHKHAYTEAEVTRLLTHADASERALVLLGAYAGLTGPEVAKLHWNNMSFEAGVLKVRGREVPTGQEVYAALERWAREQGVTQLFGGSGKVFPDLANDHQVRSALFGVCLRANVPYQAWRALRNHAGLRLLLLGHDETYIAQYLGLGTLKAVQFIARAAQRGMGQL